MESVEPHGMPSSTVDKQARGEMTISAESSDNSRDGDGTLNTPLRVPPLPHPHTPDQEDSNTVINSCPVRTQPSKSVRTQGQRVSYKGMTCDLEAVSSGLCLNILPLSCSTAVVSDENPRSFKKAMKSDDAQLWLEACQKEVLAMKEKRVWTLVERPKGANVIRGLWLFKKKYTIDSVVSKFKARYVAMGNTQREGVDYCNTFSPTGKPSSLRLLVAIMSTQGWVFHQMDAVMAFLNGTLTEDLYLEQPEGFVEPGKEHLVCKLSKSIHSLKQSPNIWGDRVKEFLVSVGFTQCKIDPCTYIRSSGQYFLAIYLHVDDLAIMGNKISLVKSQIASRCEMEDLCVAKSVGGIHISRLSHHCYSMNQSALATLIINRFDFANLKAASTPLPVTSQLYKDSDEEAEAFALEKRPYQSGVGSLMYLLMCTRKDLSHAVGVLSQHLKRPGKQHWDALIHVF